MQDEILAYDNETVNSFSQLTSAERAEYDAWANALNAQTPDPQPQDFGISDQSPFLTDAAKEDSSLYYLPVFGAWFHTHDNREALLIQTHPYRLKCEGCGQAFRMKPPPEKWDEGREKRAAEVLTRLQETANPYFFRCPAKTPGDGRIYTIDFDKEVRRWRCDCRDFRDFEKYFFKCKHVRAVERKIRQSRASSA